MLLRRTRSVHTIGMRFAIDVAFLSDDLTVVATTTLRRQTDRVCRAAGAGACSRRRRAPSRAGSSSPATGWR